MTTKFGITSTSGIQKLVDEDSIFAQAVWSAIQRFGNQDWGDVPPEDVAQNREMYKSLETGGYGFVMGSYSDYDHCPTFWIIRDMERTTVLFPEEY